VQDAQGAPLKRRSPFSARPFEPKESDYITIEPGKTGVLTIWLDDIVHAYHMKPSELYFIEFHVQFEGKRVSAQTTIPYGFPPYSKP